MCSPVLNVGLISLEGATRCSVMDVAAGNIENAMHRSIAGYNPYYLFILTIVYSKNLTTSWLQTIEHMAMFVGKSIHIQIYGQVMDLSILVSYTMSHYILFM